MAVDDIVRAVSGFFCGCADGADVATAGSLGDAQAERGVPGEEAREPALFLCFRAVVDDWELY